jgi:hypothetical protein
VTEPSQADGDHHIAGASQKAINMTEGIYRSVCRVGLGNDDDKVLRTNKPDLTNSSTSSDDVRRRYKVCAAGHIGAHARPYHRAPSPVCSVVISSCLGQMLRRCREHQPHHPLCTSAWQALWPSVYT